MIRSYSQTATEKIDYEIVLKANDTITSTVWTASIVSMALGSFRGSWLNSTVYVVGDYVMHQTNVFYVAVQGSTAVTPGTNSAYWKLVVSVASPINGNTTTKARIFGAIDKSTFLINVHIIGTSGQEYDANFHLVGDSDGRAV